MTAEDAGVDLAGLEKLGEGYEAEIFAWEGGRALRLFREGLERNVEPERIAIPAALAGGIPAPRIAEAARIAGREGTVIERIDGENLLDLVGRKPWLLAREAWATGRLHARLHSIAAPAGLQPLHARVEERIAGVEAPPRLAAIAAESLAALPGGDQLCHGDFHPGNILVERSGRHVVIDWGFCAAGLPEADVARSLTLLRLGEPIAPLPAMRLITRFFRPLAVAVYLRGYRSLRPLDAALLWRWVAVRAIDHLADPVPNPETGVEALVEEAMAAQAGRISGRPH